jgi:hypothetical protein
MMKKFIFYMFLFGFILSGLGTAVFFYKLIVLINSYPIYSDFMRILVELAPGMLMGLIGAVMLIIARTIKAKRNNRDQMRHILDIEKFRRE